MRSAQYSAFLDDARFNYSKMKWMIASLLAPEYVLAKSLSEFLAAHDSRREFLELRAAGNLPKQPTGVESADDQQTLSESRDWSATHGYFANMGGFILRFDVQAVKVPLDPHNPDEYERALFKRNPDVYPPYLPQDPAEAEAQELRQCHQGSPCANHPEGAIANTAEPVNGASLNVLVNVPTTRNQSENRPLLKVVVDDQMRQISAVSTSGSIQSAYSLHARSEDSAVLTPSTLVSQPLRSSISNSSSVAHKRGFPTSSTPTTAVDDQQFHFIADNKTKFDTFELQALPEEKDHSPCEVHQLVDSTKTPQEKEPLIPHKTWQATWALNSMQMLYAIREGIVPVPDTSAEELNDRSKGDALVKGLACLHIIWLIVQILARGIEGLAITQLEIMILGFSACALLIYFLLFHKPQDVKVPIYIDVPGVLTRGQIIQLAARSPVATLMVKQFWLHGVAIRAMANNIFPWTPGIRFQLPYLMKEPVFLNPHLIGIGGGGAIFGGIHVAAWNFAFPTPVERLLWRVSATYLVAIPMVGAIIYCFVQHVTRKSPGTSDTITDKITRPIGRVAIPLYLLARLYLLVEVFRCLAYPPPSIFQDVGWPSMIPHVN